MTGRDRPFPADPDRVAAALDDEKGLVVSRHLDVTRFAPVTPEQVLRNRLQMKMALSRYGRISFEYWEGRDVGDMRAAFDVLVALLAKEGERGAMEDR